MGSSAPSAAGGATIETFIATRVTSAHTEAANVTIKNIKRTGRDRSQGLAASTADACVAHYRSRIMLNDAARSAP